ncbi:hypothetical protein [Aliarcobacter butzleri]|uniref:Uncharacterized protein n=1 Tax=Aliarcobacter butzleri L348 TaxID=1447256 RepID=A0A0G9JWN2_9BACT|nr:hypothetical protein [Aliarcobacter butzleri]KLD98661.1 hypothetical protein AA20_08190 [Aliarcobacter butzleri L348]
MKYDIKKYDMKTLVKLSIEYKEYMKSEEIQQLQKKIDNELTIIENEWKAFLKVYKDLDKNQHEYTIEYKEKQKEVEKKQEQKREQEKEKEQTLLNFQEKLNELRMNLAIYDTKKEESDDILK